MYKYYNIKYYLQFYNIISNCFSLGKIIDGSGGIVASGAGGNNGQTIGLPYCNCTITNCFSAGDMDTGSGGICGQNSGTCIITDCYSKGRIGDGSGGICASGSPYATTVTNCYAQGSINVNSFGIYGTGSPTLSNVYSRDSTQSPLLPLSQIKDSLGLLPVGNWHKTHKYPTLKAYHIDSIWIPHKNVKNNQLKHVKRRSLARSYKKLNAKMWKHERIQNKVIK